MFSKDIDYNFLWYGRRIARRDKVTLTKEKEGLGIHDFQTLDDVATIREATQLWEKGWREAWSSWMNE